MFCKYSLLAYALLFSLSPCLVFILLILLYRKFLFVLLLVCKYNPFCGFILYSSTLILVVSSCDWKQNKNESGLIFPDYQRNNIEEGLEKTSLEEENNISLTPVV